MLWSVCGCVDECCIVVELCMCGIGIDVVGCIGCD